MMSSCFPADEYVEVTINGRVAEIDFGESETDLDKVLFFSEIDSLIQINSYSNVNR